MIKVVEDRLCDKPTVMCAEIPADDLQRAILHYADVMGLPVTVKQDTLQVGGFFGKSYPCVAVYNKNHMSDFYNYAIVQRREGNYVYLYMYLGGNSKNYTKQVMSSGTQSRFLKSISKPNQMSQQEEHAYYDMVRGAIGNAVYSFNYVVRY